MLIPESNIVPYISQLLFCSILMNNRMKHSLFKNLFLIYIIYRKVISFLKHRPCVRDDQWFWCVDHVLGDPSSDVDLYEHEFSSFSPGPRAV